MKQFILSILLLIYASLSVAQSTSGSTGLLNIPSADMQQDGIFMAGGNYLPEAFSLNAFPYNTVNYYFNVTFLPFVEINYRLTLIKTERSKAKYGEQDRSFGVRLRLFKEKKYIPAIVIGGNDIYSQESGKGNQFFSSLYGVGTKTFQAKGHIFKVTAGIGFNAFSRNQLEGFFGGITYSPAFLQKLSLMADYDTNAVNLGASALFFKRLYLNVFLNDFNNIVGGLALKLPLYNSNKSTDKG